jgi:hypothetical protein
MPIFHHSLTLPNTVQVRLRWSLIGRLCSNILAGEVGSFTSSQAVADALATAVLGHFTTSGLAALSATTTVMLGVGLRDIRSDGLVEYLSAPAGVAGTGAGDPLPNSLAAVVTLRTARAGKRYRGRVYVGGAIVAENDAAGHIVAAYNTALKAFLTDVQADMLAQGITLGVLSRPQYDPITGLVGTWAGAITPVTAVETRDVIWDSQRRREQ